MLHAADMIEPVTVLWEKHHVRTFGWGAVYVSDTEELAPGDYDFHTGGPFWAAPDNITIAAVHAGAVGLDVADVELLVQVRDTAVPNAGYTAVVNVPSGVLNIGDADDSDNLPLSLGQ